MKKGRPKQYLVDSVEFIFAEVMRFNQILQSNFRSVPRDELLFSLPDFRHRGGELICGRAAAIRIQELAELAAERSGLRDRIHRTTIQEPLEYLLVRRFLQEVRTLDVQNVERVLSAAARRAKGKCSTTTHFIPCHLTFVEEPNELRFGPVGFRSRAAFRKVIAPKVREFAAKDRLETNPKNRFRGMLVDILDYYRSFKWVAEITIENCDERTSSQLALGAVTSGLDFIHIMFGAGFTDDMRIGGPKIVKDVRGGIRIDQDGLLIPQWTRSLVGQANFPVGWSEMLGREDIERLTHLAGIAFETAVHPDLKRPLSRRFIDAIHWYGEAARDTSAATQVVKYVTALERMLMTEEKDDISATVAQRASVFCFDAHDAVARNRRFEEVRELYRLRSQLVHGSKSPFSKDIADGVYKGAMVAREAILTCLLVFGEDGLKHSTISTEKLGKWFGAIYRNAAH